MSAVTPPTNIGYGTVVWRAVSDIEDGVDVDDLPDFLAPTGTVAFKASVTQVRDVTAAPAPLTVLRDTITAVLDSSGYLCTPLADGSAGARGIKLIATDDPDLNPTGWTYNVNYSVKGLNGRTLAMKSHDISVPEGEVVDLSVVGPVASSPGNAVVVGPAPNLTGATATTLGPTAPATATVTGTSPNYALAFGIPRGSRWFFGTGAPGTVTGSLPGDTYVDTATGNYYTLS